MVERERGAWAESIQHLEEGVRTAEAIGSPLPEGRSRYELGLLWKRKEEKDKAKEQLLAAIAIFERIGAAKWLERAKDALRDVGG